MMTHLGVFRYRPSDRCCCLSNGLPGMQLKLILLRIVIVISDNLADSCKLFANESHELVLAPSYSRTVPLFGLFTSVRC